LERVQAREETEEVRQEVFQGTLTVMTAIYGAESHQVATLREAARTDRTPQRGIQIITGTLKNVLAEIDAGLLGSLEKRVTGDVLADFVGLARFILQERGERGKNVAAVLAAAAFEDTIRRMGATFAGTIGRDDLQDVIQTLKKADVLVRPQLSIAQSYLSFRNHALHADWDKIEVAATHSVLGFVEQLVIKYFG
jgi:hypothetical protein